MPSNEVFEKNGFHHSAPAGADLSTHQYKFVKYDGSGDFILASSAGEAVVGVLENDPADEESCLVRTLGYGRVIASAAISVGANVATTAAGLAVTATTGDVVRGEAVTSSSASGDWITIRFKDMIEP